jgi:Transcription factor WhiB
MIATALDGWLVDMPWMQQAACAGTDLSVFYPASGDHSYTVAREIRGRCPVIEDCRATCDRAEGRRPLGEIFGMCAGESPKERLARRRNVKQR